MKTLAKSNIRAQDIFFHKQVAIKGTNKNIQMAYIDGNDAYFLETRCTAGYLVESVTFSSVSKLIKSL